MRQRYYNTDIKRFINQDILEGNLISSQSLNRYAYVEGNPVNYNDPFGLSPRQILQPYVNLGHDILSMASMIPGPVGAIAVICDIGLSYATGDFSALGKSLLSAIITGGFKTYINNACKIPKALKYIAGTVFAGYGLSIISKSYTMIRDSALQFVDLMFSGGSPLDYAHVLCNFFQGLAGLAGGVGFAVGSAVGMVRQCFVAGTKVKTEDGDKNIEEIKAGDRVWSYDPVTGEEGLKEVKQTFENETETLVHVTVSNVSNENDKETIDTTVRHPFYVVSIVSLSFSLDTVT